MPDQDPLYDLLQRMQPSLKQLFSRFRMPPEVVEKILEDCLMVLVYRHDQLAHPNRWLLRTVRFRCLRYWRQQRFEVCRKAQGAIRQWLDDETTGEPERQRRREELEGRLANLPERCRTLLGRLFHLGALESRSSAEAHPPRPKPQERFPRSGANTPESPTVRCMHQLLRNLVEDPPPDLEDLRLL